MFTGTGRVEFETNGEFYAKNYDSSDHIANSMQLAVGGSANTLYLRNRYNDLAANILSFSTTATNHSIWYYNYQIGQTTANGNNMVLETGASYYRSNIHNFNFETVNSTTNSGVLANRVSLYSTATYNQLSLDNDNLGDTAGNAKYANSIFMYHAKSSYSNYIGVNNYRQGTDNKYANYLYLNANGTNYTSSIYNFKHEYLDSNNNAVTANYLLLLSNSTSNYAGLFNYDRTNNKISNMVYLSSKPSSTTVEGTTIPANNSLNLVNYQNNANQIVNSKIIMNDNLTFQCQNRAGFDFIGNGKQFIVNDAANGVAIAATDISPDAYLQSGIIYLVAPNGVYIEDWYDSQVRVRRL